MSRVKLAAALAVLFVAGGGLAVALATRSGDSAKGSARGEFGQLGWVKTPHIYRYKTIPNDRILAGRLRNGSFKQYNLVARRDIKLFDAAGHEIDHAATFAPGYGRDIYPPSYRRTIPEADQIRLGLKAKLKPGASVPLTLSWRVKRGGSRATRIEVRGGGALALPAR